MSTVRRGPTVLYVRPADLRVAEQGHPGVEVVIREVVRTGPLVRAEASAAYNNAPVQIEIPHLHFDRRHFVTGARLRLRMMQFSIYPEAAPQGPATGHDALGVAATRERTI